MFLSGNVPALAAPQPDALDAAEISRCLDSAAELVQSFAERGAIGALDALLAAAGDTTPADTAGARLAAAEALQQTATLHEEVGRFLSLTRK